MTDPLEAAIERGARALHGAWDDDEMTPIERKNASRMVLHAAGVGELVAALGRIATFSEQSMDPSPSGMQNGLKEITKDARAALASFRGENADG